MKFIKWNLFINIIYIHNKIYDIFSVFKFIDNNMDVVC